MEIQICAKTVLANKQWPPFVYESIWRRLIEDYKRLHETMDLPSPGTGSAFMELLE